ncbi:helix-turn-helix domain-containing protein [Azospirillum sp. HJ39]|uniref:helix-turn-helix domain-containing protein n=1 Tax=Azospirillum sp. HJ39 TaxID=3159496 RepID=UPI0035574ACF
MNAETGSEPESPKKRGRIPQSAWPQILERYRSGVTLSAIAREFECTPSAISYIIKKAEAAGDQGGDQSVGQGEAPQDDVTTGGDAEAAAPAAETVSEAPAAEPAPATPATPAGAAPAEPRRAAGRATRGTLTRAPRSEAAPSAEAPAQSVEAPAPAPVPAPTETLRLNRPDPNPAPVPAPAPAAPAASPATATADAAAPRVAGQPTPPVDAVEGRLRDTAKACISAYRGWRQQPSEATIQALSDTVHELRKALARVEIDMSASRREEQAIRPIPIPAHRASRRPN